MKDNKGKSFIRSAKTALRGSKVASFATIAAAAAVITVSAVYAVNRIEEKQRADEASRQAEISRAVEEALNKVPEIVPKLDDNAENTVSGPIDVDRDTSGGGSVTLEYTDRVTISKSTGVVEMHFKNPVTSNQDMLIQIVIQGKNGEYIIMQSDAVPPGYILRTSKADQKLLDLTPTGKYDGFYYIYYYNLNTGDKAVVNTKIPIEITVTK